MGVGVRGRVSGILSCREGFGVHFYLSGCVSESGPRGKQTCSQKAGQSQTGLRTILYGNPDTAFALKIPVGLRGWEKKRGPDNETSFQRCIYAIGCDLKINI